jgi:hypothetical protein
MDEVIANKHTQVAHSAGSARSSIVSPLCETRGRRNRNGSGRSAHH